MDFLYSLLKIISMIATGAFGALGLLTKYKNDQGRITKWGKVALGGILISSCVSLGLYMLETSKAKAAAIKAKADAEATALKLETILVNARTTAEQQKLSLAETNQIKSDLAETLRKQKESLEKTDSLAEGMKSSLTAQQSLLTGNQKILGGLTSSVNKLDVVGTNVSRSINLLGPIRLSFMLRIPAASAAMKDYRDYIRREIPEVRGQYYIILPLYQPLASQIMASNFINSMAVSLTVGKYFVMDPDPSKSTFLRKTIYYGLRYQTASSQINLSYSYDEDAFYLYVETEYFQDYEVSNQFLSYLDFAKQPLNLSFLLGTNAMEQLPFSVSFVQLFMPNRRYVKIENVEETSPGNFTAIIPSDAFQPK
jgi:hypothetical protein